jgi:predicted DNA binding CopG/RHH family protein
LSEKTQIEKKQITVRLEESKFDAFNRYLKKHALSKGILIENYITSLIEQDQRGAV